MVDIGEKAPHFVLYDTNKDLMALSDYRGKPLIILFFPMAFSGTCTDEMNKMQDMIKDIASLDAQVIGISVDSVHVLEEFKKKNGYEFDFLSDFNKDITRSYGVLCTDFTYGMKGVPQRAVFILDYDGKLVYKEVLDDAGNLPNFEQIQNTLKVLKK